MTATASAKAPATFLDAIGGPAVAQALADAFYARVLTDRVLTPLFRDPTEPHADRMAWWLTEVFGGPPLHSERRGGFAAMVAAHRGLRITELQRLAWVQHMMSAAAKIGLAPGATRTLADYIDTASHFAVAGSNQAF